ncbi:hypothetical protein ACTXG7_10790 [Mycolicibacterium sp. Dal123E01]|uniref:hypothetical protein n=1 Tax=Mycolicibacterium sp. Dal123E01 TaxID=3457578 RepID=UPI00403EA676
MSMQFGIRSRQAVFSGAALGGLYWGAISLIVVTHRHSGDPFFSSHFLRLAATSAAILLAGVGLLFASHTKARTAGVALIVCALSGWIAAVTAAVQFGLWRM